MERIVTIAILCAFANWGFSQNFGIDQPNPTEKLDVNGNIKAAGTISAGGNIRVSTSGEAKFEYFGSNADRGYVGWQTNPAAGVALWNRDNTPIFFGTTNAERMRIDAAGNVGIGTTNPTQKLDVNGTIKGGRTSQRWTSKRTGYVNSSSWTTIPGLSINFDLDRSAIVQVIANGTQRTGGTDASYVCHQAYRMVVDGAAGGDPTHGERLFVTRGDVAWWGIWTYASSKNLSAGNHTISVQTRASSGSGGCFICAEASGALTGYTDCDLIITAVYE